MQVVLFTEVASKDCLFAYSGNIYYVNSTGNNKNDGKSANTAWQTLEKVNSVNFGPGDTILFKRGGTWYGTLNISNKGYSANPITFGAYGEGERPKVYNTYQFSGGATFDRYSLIPLKVGSFEEEGHWVLSGNNRIDSQMAHHGQKSLRIPPSSVAYFNVECRSDSRYLLTFHTKSYKDILLLLQIRVNNNNFLQNESQAKTFKTWGKQPNWVSLERNASGWWKMEIVWKSPIMEVPIAHIGIKNGSSNTLWIDSVRLEPLWSSVPEFENVFKIHGLSERTEMIYNGRRISLREKISDLENHNYSYQGGIWYIKDINGNPEENGTDIQFVTLNKNAVHVTEAQHIVIDGLDISGGSGVRGHLGALAIYDSENIEVRNCLVTNSTTAALMLFNCKNIKVSGCEVNGGSTGGIYLRYCINCIISENDVNHNGQCRQDINDLHGIGIGYWSRGIKVQYNRIHNNGYGGGEPNKGSSALELYSAGESQVRYNLIYNNWRGAISVDSGHDGNSDNILISHNLIIDNGLIGSGGANPAFSLQAHSPSSSNGVKFNNNTIIRQRTGDLWSLATTKKPEAVRDGDLFYINKIQGQIVFWEGGDLRVLFNGAINPPVIIKSKEGKWHAQVVSVNNAPAAIVLMSPLKIVKDAEVKRNIVYNTLGNYDVAIGEKAQVKLNENCYWRDSAEFRVFHYNYKSIGWIVYNKLFDLNSLFNDPMFINSTNFRELTPTISHFTEIGAAPETWFDKVIAQ